MQVQVPQNIAMEDRIIGNLTMTQFLIIIVGGFLSFFIITSQGAPAWISKGVGGTLAFITVILAMGKFNDQPMYRFIRYIFAFILRPKTRVWHKNGGDVILIKPAPQTVSTQQRSVVKNVSKADIARLADVLDSRGKSGVIPPTQPKKLK